MENYGRLRTFSSYPNEYIYWTIQIVMYPFMTGLVAGAFVLSSLYHVFGVKAAEGTLPASRWCFSFALLPVAHAAAACCTCSSPSGASR